MPDVSPAISATPRRRVSFLIAGNCNDAFYSQIAVLAAAMRQLQWQRWEPSIHAFLGHTEREATQADWAKWARYLADVHVTTIEMPETGGEDNWPQVDATLELAPRDADVLVSLDADTLPITDFEDVLDRVADSDLVAGVMAHFSPPGMPTHRDWERLADDLISPRLIFNREYSLMASDTPTERRTAPFYVNGGVVFYSRSVFERLVPMYLALRRRVMARVTNGAFSGQIATTLAVTAVGLDSYTLPLRYNFPNDPQADMLHPDEVSHIVFHHYLRTECFDRHRVFATGDSYAEFLNLELDPVNGRFQAAVRRVIGRDYPFT
jgi:hypothetical protein